MAIVGMDPEALEAAQPDAYRMFSFLTRSQGFVLAFQSCDLLRGGGACLGRIP